MKVIFVASGPIEWGSARMRCYWPARYMDDATVVQFGEELPKGADVYIWQKQAHTGAIDLLENARHYWDVCDPMWWFSPKESTEILRRMDGVVASNEPLLDDLLRWVTDYTPLSGQGGHTIPDRLELSHFHTHRQHRDVFPLRIIWYGVAQNRIALHAAIPTLERFAANGYHLELTVMDDRPDAEFRVSERFSVFHTRWELDAEVDVIAGHDVALLPPYPGKWGEVKSNNKTITAYACGLPVTEGIEYRELEALWDADTRQTAGRNGRAVAERDYDVRQSARDWERMLC